MQIAGKWFSFAKTQMAGGIEYRKAK